MRGHAHKMLDASTNTLTLQARNVSSSNRSGEMRILGEGLEALRFRSDIYLDEENKVH